MTSPSSRHIQTQFECFSLLHNIAQFAFSLFRDFSKSVCVCVLCRGIAASFATPWHAYGVGQVSPNRPYRIAAKLFSFSLDFDLAGGQRSGFWVQDPEPRVLDPESWVQDPGSRILEPGLWILDPGAWIQDPGSWIHDRILAFIIQAADLQFGPYGQPRPRRLLTIMHCPTPYRYMLFGEECQDDGNACSQRAWLACKGLVDPD